MKLSREMIIRGEPGPVSAMMDEIERRAAGYWKRDRGEEEALGRRDRLSSTLYVLASEDLEDKPVVLYFHGQEDGDGLRSTVIFRDMSAPSCEQNNSIIEKFHARFVDPLAGAFGVSVELTPDQFHERDWLSEAAVEKLHRFSRMANKGLGGALPVDHERWLDFVVTAHRGGTRLPAHLLRTLLIEDWGWDFEDADRLAGKYAFGGDVLSYAEGQPA